MGDLDFGYIPIFHLLEAAPVFCRVSHTWLVVPLRADPVFFG